ncbi:MAG: arginine deiminase family protein [Patescibacteria group bacterium]
MKVYVRSETGLLQAVVLGYPDNFHGDQAPIEVVNNTQAHYYGRDDQPTAQRLQPEFNALRQLLESYGVTVFYPKPCAVPDQLTPRDIGFVIDDIFFVAHMAKVSRADEYQGIKFLLDQMPNVTFVPDNVVIEGGDIVVDDNTVFVGISQRTTMKGYQWLAEQLPEFNVIPVSLKPLNAGEDCLHLDCVFVPVGSKHALVYPDGIADKVPALGLYEWLRVTKEEQGELATNVLSLSKNCVISRDSAKRVNDLLRSIGLEVIPLKFDEAPKTGGSFRCCTLPLIRR